MMIGSVGTTQLAPQTCKGATMKRIRTMSYEELLNTRAQIEVAIELHRAGERQALMNILQRGELPVTKTSRDTGAHPLKGKKLPPKYRNPDDHSQVWAGRGNKPRWLAAALKKRSVNLESFAVK